MSVGHLPACRCAQRKQPTRRPRATCGLKGDARRRPASGRLVDAGHDESTETRDREQRREHAQQLADSRRGGSVCTRRSIRVLATLGIPGRFWLSDDGAHTATLVTRMSPNRSLCRGPGPERAGCPTPLSWSWPRSPLRPPEGPCGRPAVTQHASAGLPTINSIISGPGRAGCAGPGLITRTR